MLYTAELVCPICGIKAQGEEQLEHIFGWRHVNGKKIPQSYCHSCRSKKYDISELKQDDSAYTNLEELNELNEVPLDGEDSQTLAPNTLDDILTLECEESIYPMKSIKVDKAFYTTFELKRKYDKIPSLVILDSDFQRKDVWKEQQKRELVESVLMGLPLPIFYFNEDKKGRLIVIDGRQRLTALFEFIDGKFKLDKLKILTEFNKCCFNDLEPILQSKIEDYQLIAHVIQPPTPDRIKFDIFDRVNRAGTQLNKQEIRNALYQGNATTLLNDISLSEEFKLSTENAFRNDKRMKDRYLILRFIAFYLYFNKRLLIQNQEYQYTSDIDELLGLTMEYLNNLNDSQVNEIKHISIKCFEQIIYYMPNNAFRLVDVGENGEIKRYPININIFENIMFAMSLIPYCDSKLKFIVENEFSEMKSSLKFRDSINNHRDSDTKVNARYTMIMEIVEKLNDK